MVSSFNQWLPLSAKSPLSKTRQEILEDDPSHDKVSCSQPFSGASKGKNSDIYAARRQALGVMAKHTYEEAVDEELICSIVDELGTSVLKSVALRVKKGEYVVFPEETNQRWASILCLLNVGSSMTLNSSITEIINDMLPLDSDEVAIGPASRFQVLQELADLAHARKSQGAAFIRSEKSVIIWAEESFDLLNDAKVMHQQLITFLWHIAEKPTPGQGKHFFNVISQHSMTPVSPSDSSGSYPFKIEPTSSYGHDMFITGTETPGRLFLNKTAYDSGNIDIEEKGQEQYEERPTIILAAIVHGLAFSLAVLICALQIRQALQWSLLDGHWIRMAVALVAPFLFFVIMFFCDNIFGILFMVVGPVRQLHTNSRYYSGIKPRRTLIGRLPHITIQMPVYKEDLAFVLRPSFESIKKAIRTYELQGGSASIIVSEDGMVLVDESERNARIQYYDENNITWIARPKHGKDGFQRAGRFKKASNLNFTYDVLIKAEKRLEEKEEEHTDYSKQMYDLCLQEVLAEIHPDACGAGRHDMGDIILLVDSDTRIPQDCFLDAAIEMNQCADVGILQHCSGVMLVSTSFFEGCIAYFTKIVNFSISFVVSNGDMAPFMGHNAYLRWSAMKEVSRMVVEDGRSQLKIWSDEHVSEDFVMALDMIDRGYTVRWATYANSEYLEGVSLSCDDELNRWQKYAWGVSEMIFNPIKHWYRGPITPLFRRFLWSRTPIHYKWASCSYCFSYYSIALALPMSIGMALLQGWIGPDANAPYLPSFQVLVACIFVFLIGGTTAISFLRFRAGYGSIFGLLKENLSYMPFFTIFFGGLPYHISTALMSHLLGINMTWGATLKDIELTNFFVEAPRIGKRHRKLFILCFTVLTGIAVLSTNSLPVEWRIQGFYTIFPCILCYSLHLLYPILLNPNLLRFSF